MKRVLATYFLAVGLVLLTLALYLQGLQTLRQIADQFMPVLP